MQGTKIESFVSPICLPWPSESVRDLGTKGTIIGWGRDTSQDQAQDRDRTKNVRWVSMTFSEIFSF